MIDLSSDDSIAATTPEGKMRAAANRWRKRRTEHQELHRAAFFTREGRRVGVDQRTTWPNGPVAEFQLRLTVDVETGFRCFPRHLATVSRWDGTFWTPVFRSVQLTVAIEMWCLITGKDTGAIIDDVMRALA